MSSGGAALQPTFTGHVATTQDGLILFEACLQGHLSHVPRRPHDRERSSLIRSGCVFIYEENASGIKRWTDGVTWSPSRILGNFLVYRELDKPFPPGEKKRAMKKGNRRPSRPGEPYARPLARADAYSPNSSQSGSYGADRAASEIERQLIGSLIDSYGFKHDGLVKKTMSVTVQGVTHHLVSYYNVNDVIHNNLRTPSQAENLHYIRPRAELTSKQSFRSPLEEVDDLDGLRDGPYGYRVGPPSYSQEYKQQYYLPQSYPHMAPHPPLGTAYSAPVHPLPPGYMHTPVHTPQLPPQHRGEYGHYDQSAYGRQYEPLNTSVPDVSKSIPPTPATTLPPSMSDVRAQPHSMMYPPATLQRSMSNLSPVSMDSRSSIPYRTPSYQLPATASPVDPQRPVRQSPTQMKFEERRDDQPAPPHLYTGQRPYYDHAGPQIPSAHYAHGQAIAQWAGPGPHQH